MSEPSTVTTVRLERNPDEATAIARQVIEHIAGQLLERIDDLADPEGMLQRKGAYKLLGIAGNTFDRLRDRDDFPRARQMPGTVKIWSRRELLEWALTLPLVEKPQQRRMEV